MEDYIVQNKQAWEYNAYDFWVRQTGGPAVLAARILQDPKRGLKWFDAYFDRYEGLRVANICGSCGKKAVPMALLGAEMTVFDISEDNCRYALELAEAAGVTIDYQVCDVLEADMDRFGGYFDVVFMEGGILHYFHDISRFMAVMRDLLKPGGKLICSDFHPMGKIMEIQGAQQPGGDYFAADIFQGEMAHARFYDPEIREKFPKCSYRRYTLCEIINAVIQSGFEIRRFDEHPSWTDPKLPGEFTVIARKA